MSISAIGGGTTPWWAAPASGASGVTADAAAASSSTAATNASGLGNFFQQFASDLQSLLTQVQTTSGAGATTASATTTAPATTATATTATTATTTTPADAVGQATTQQPEAVHHHHHHGGGEGGGGGGNPLQNAANQFVSQVAQALGGGSGNATPAAGTPANGASTLAADIVHALQNYGAFAAAPTSGAVSTTA